MKVSAVLLPQITLLDKTAKVVISSDTDETAKLLVSKLREFGVGGSIVDVKQGPVVTAYRLMLDAGIKYSKVVGLADDLALDLGVSSILVRKTKAKSTIGIQVPNQNRKGISLKEVLDSEPFRTTDAFLPVALGKDVNGLCVVTDLSSLPHLLVAGTTGSGKSISINGMIMSLLFKTSPDDLRMILIDPKRVEFALYAKMPHLLTPIVTEHEQAGVVLRNLIKEMERRLEVLSKRKVRDIGGYNLKSKNRMPHIVVFIDEFADLIMGDVKDIEQSVVRLAQMARATGIHIVLATQRPSVDVITGLIKGNFPSRLSLRVATRTDSKVILDCGGAEALLGKGDMLFNPVGAPAPVRVHGQYVSDVEVKRVVGFWKRAEKVKYMKSLTMGVEGDFEYQDENIEGKITPIEKVSSAAAMFIGVGFIAFLVITILCMLVLFIF